MFKMRRNHIEDYKKILSLLIDKDMVRCKDFMKEVEVMNEKEVDKFLDYLYDEFCILYVEGGHTLRINAFHLVQDQIKCLLTDDQIELIKEKEKVFNDLNVMQKIIYSEVLYFVLKYRKLTLSDIMNAFSLADHNWVVPFSYDIADIAIRDLMKWKLLKFNFNKLNNSNLELKEQEYVSELDYEDIPTFMKNIIEKYTSHNEEYKLEKLMSKVVPSLDKSEIKIEKLYQIPNDLSDAYLVFNNTWRDFLFKDKNIIIHKGDVIFMDYNNNIIGKISKEKIYNMICLVFNNFKDDVIIINDIESDLSLYDDKLVKQDMINRIKNNLNL